MSKLFHFFVMLFWLIVFSLSGFAQQTPTPTPTPPKESEVKKIEQDIEDIFRNKKKKSSASNPADFGDEGVLQIEYSYGGYFRSKDFRSQHAGTLTVTLAATEKIGLEFDIDTISTQQDQSFVSAKGVGDSRLGIQFDLLDESKNAPSFAVSYFAKLPTASVNKNLGTGRFDHQISTLFSKKIRGFDVNFNTGLLINGKQGEKGFVTGGQFALGVSRDFNQKLNLQGEVFGESKDSDEPQGLFGAGIGTYQINEKLSLNFGVKIGLTQNSPRYGLTFGVSYSIADIFKKGK